jgi:hypothetical protein
VAGVTDREQTPRWASGRWGKAIVVALRKLGLKEDDEEWPG